MDILDVTITSRKWIIIFLLIFDWTKDLRDLCANNGLNSRFCGISSSIVDALLVDFAICKGDLAFMDERCPIDSQNSPPSVIFSFSRRNYVPNIPLKVTVSTENTGSHFRNFVLQARDYSTSLSVGSFNSTHTDDDVRLVVCNDTLKDTATAGETFRERSTFIVYWTPPPGFQKTVVFHVDAVTTGACGRASATSAEIIPHLEECFNIGESPYLGSVSHSKSGYECLRWNSPDVKNIFVGLDNTTYVSNFCRSQTSDSTPGCYVMSDRVTFEECDIPKCTSIASQFIEFGESVGDERLSRDQTPSVLNFTTKFPITNSRHKAAAIFEDGVVVLGSSSHSFEPFHLWPNGTFIYDRLEDCREKRTCKSRSVIAPFWTNIRRQQTQTGQGYVFYRQSTDHDLMLRLGDIINENRRFGEEHQQYKPSWALIVTWHLVSDNASETAVSRLNTFQAVLVAGKNESFVLYNYEMRKWSDKEKTALVGYNPGNAFDFLSHDFFTTNAQKASLLGEVVSMTANSNVGRSGQRMYDVHFEPPGSKRLNGTIVRINYPAVTTTASTDSGSRGDQNPCQDVDCGPNGRCDPYTGVCICDPGYTGSRCQVDIDECDTNPCQNGGVCTDRIGSYHCACRPGYTGTRCEHNINDCLDSPCHNGGICQDGVDSFACICHYNYTGQFCEIPIDQCSSNPCKNNGKCIPSGDSYICKCPPGYFGDTCRSRYCFDGSACEEYHECHNIDTDALNCTCSNNPPNDGNCQKKNHGEREPDFHSQKVIKTHPDELLAEEYRKDVKIENAIEKEKAVDIQDGRYLNRPLLHGTTSRDAVEHINPHKNNEFNAIYSINTEIGSSAREALIIQMKSMETMSLQAYHSDFLERHQEANHISLSKENAASSRQLPIKQITQKSRAHSIPNLYLSMNGEEDKVRADGQETRVKRSTGTCEPVSQDTTCYNVLWSYDSYTDISLSNTVNGQTFPSQRSARGIIDFFHSVPCHDLFKFFVCAAILPKCSADSAQAILPSQSFCNLMKDSCEETLFSFASSRLKFNDYFPCSSYPTDDAESVGIPALRTTTTTVSITETTSNSKEFSSLATIKEITSELSTLTIEPITLKSTVEQESSVATSAGSLALSAWSTNPTASTSELSTLTLKPITLESTVEQESSVATETSLTSHSMRTTSADIATLSPLSTAPTASTSEPSTLTVKMTTLQPTIKQESTVAAYTSPKSNSVKLTSADTATLPLSSTSHIASTSELPTSTLKPATELDSTHAMDSSEMTDSTTIKAHSSTAFLSSTTSKSPSNATSMPPTIGQQTTTAADLSQMSTGADRSTLSIISSSPTANTFEPSTLNLMPNTPSTVEQGTISAIDTNQIPHSTETTSTDSSTMSVSGDTSTASELQATTSNPTSKLPYTQQYLSQTQDLRIETTPVDTALDSVENFDLAQSSASEVRGSQTTADVSLTQSLASTDRSSESAFLETSSVTSSVASGLGTPSNNVDSDNSVSVEAITDSAAIASSISTFGPTSSNGFLKATITVAQTISSTEPSAANTAFRTSTANIGSIENVGISQATTDMQIMDLTEATTESTVLETSAITFNSTESAGLLLAATDASTDMQAMTLTETTDTEASTAAFSSNEIIDMETTRIITDAEISTGALYKSIAPEPSDVTTGTTVSNIARSESIALESTVGSTSDSSPVTSISTPGFDTVQETTLATTKSQIQSSTLSNNAGFQSIATEFTVGSTSELSTVTSTTAAVDTAQGTSLTTTTLPSHSSTISNIARVQSTSTHESSIATSTAVGINMAQKTTFTTTRLPSQSSAISNIATVQGVTTATASESRILTSTTAGVNTSQETTLVTTRLSRQSSTDSMTSNEVPTQSQNTETSTPAIEIDTSTAPSIFADQGQSQDVVSTTTETSTSKALVHVSTLTGISELPKTSISPSPSALIAATEDVDLLPIITSDSETISAPTTTNITPVPASTTLTKSELLDTATSPSTPSTISVTRSTAMLPLLPTVASTTEKLDTTTSTDSGSNRVVTQLSGLSPSTLAGDLKDETSTNPPNESTAVTVTPPSAASHHGITSSSVTSIVTNQPAVTTLSEESVTLLPSFTVPENNMTSVPSQAGLAKQSDFSTSTSSAQSVTSLLSIKVPENTMTLVSAVTGWTSEQNDWTTSSTEPDTDVAAIFPQTGTTEQSPAFSTSTANTSNNTLRQQATDSLSLNQEETTSHTSTLDMTTRGNSIFQSTELPTTSDSSSSNTEKAETQSVTTWSTSFSSLTSEAAVSKEFTSHQPSPPTKSSSSTTAEPTTDGSKTAKSLTQTSIPYTTGWLSSASAPFEYDTSSSVPTRESNPTAVSVTSRSEFTTEQTSTVMVSTLSETESFMTSQSADKYSSPAMTSSTKTTTNSDVTTIEPPGDTSSVVTSAIALSTTQEISSTITIASSISTPKRTTQLSIFSTQPSFPNTGLNSVPSTSPEDSGTTSSNTSIPQETFQSSTQDGGELEG